jgi:hypothetical protein
VPDEVPAASCYGRQGTVVPAVMPQRPNGCELVEEWGTLPSGTDAERTNRPRSLTMKMCVLCSLRTFSTLTSRSS